MEKEIKTLTETEFRDIYLNNTLVKAAKILGCTRNNVLYHARRHNLIGIKGRGGPPQKLIIKKGNKEDK